MSPPKEQEEKFAPLERLPEKDKPEGFPTPQSESIPSILLFPSAVTNPGVQTKQRKNFVINGDVKSSASVVSVAGNAVETTLNSYQFEPNEWHVGSTLRVTLAGVYTTDDASANVAIKLKIGSTTYHTITTTAGTISNAPWRIEWTVMIVTIGTAGTAESFASAKTNNVNKDSGGTATIAIDTTAKQLLSATATWASGDAGDSIKIRQFLVETIH